MNPTFFVVYNIKWGDPKNQVAVSVGPDRPWVGNGTFPRYIKSNFFSYASSSTLHPRH